MISGQLIIVVGTYSVFVSTAHNFALHIIKRELPLFCGVVLFCMMLALRLRYILDCPNSGVVDPVRRLCDRVCVPYCIDRKIEIVHVVLFIYVCSRTHRGGRHSHGCCILMYHMYDILNYKTTRRT